MQGIGPLGQAATQLWQLVHSAAHRDELVYLDARRAGQLHLSQSWPRLRKRAGSRQMRHAGQQAEQGHPAP